MLRRVPWVFAALTLFVLAVSGTAQAVDSAACRGCHGQPSDGKVDQLHHAYYFQYGKPCADCHFPDGVTIHRECGDCHTPPASHPDCMGCHSSPQGSRRAVVPEFSMASHHVQSPSGPVGSDCLACHDLSAHGKGTIRLRSMEGGISISYTTPASATNACLSCHDDNSKDAVPFSDLKTPISSTKNWDGKSIDAKYSSPVVVNSNKYPPTTTAPYMGAPYNTVPNVQRALSSHGNPGLNAANGTTSDVRVPCLACHNSHGSPQPSLLYSTDNYTPTDMEDFCWDCHTNDPGSPWKASEFMPGNWVKDYFADPRWGMNDGTGFKTNWMGSFAYKNSSFMSSHLYPSKRKISDTNWPRSVVTCTSCHDPHGVDPGNTKREYMVPLLKGTWMISPFKEDRAPLASYTSPLRDGGTNRYQNADQPRSAPDLAYNNTPNPGGGYANGSGGSGHEGFFIEDNTFGVYNSSTLTAAQPGDWRNANLAPNRITETDTQFAGLCLGCHPKTDLKTAWAGHGTVKGWGGATRDLFPSAMASGGGGEGPGNSMHNMAAYSNSDAEEGGTSANYGRGYRWGVNPKTQRTSGYKQTDYHQFTCSKCHSPHATKFPRLLTTNCLDSRGTHTTYSLSKSSRANNCHSTQRSLAWNTLTPWLNGTPTVMYTVSATSNTGGTISPGGPLLVTSGTSRTFTMTPNSGYTMAYLTVDGVNLGPLTTYTMSNITADHTVHATFASTGVNYTIVASAGSGGTISPSGSTLVAQGAGQNYTITPNSGYTVADVVVDGVSQGPVFSYHFPPVNANHTISVTFATASTITATAGTGGTIDPGGAIPVITGTSKTFTITPNLGYAISQVTTDGTNRGAITSYTFTNVTANHTINATFSVVPTYTITVSAGLGGKISPDETVVVSSGASQTFTITPDPGFAIASVVTDGTNRGAISSYTYTNITSNRAISATFVPITYTVSAGTGTGGWIDPSGDVAVNQGSDQVFMVYPNPGYAIENLKVDGVSYGAYNNWNFANINENHTISATFRAPSFTISASSAAGGMISPLGNVEVALGLSQTFTIAPGLGYKIADVQVDGLSQGAISSYTFTNVSAPHTISVTYATTPTFTITAIAGTGGTISPTGSVGVNLNSNQPFTFTPDLGYAIANVTVDGVSQGAVPSHTFTNVTANHNISVTFAATAVYTITASAGTGGTITPSGAVQVNSGSNLSFTIAPDSGYQIANVTTDGTSRGAISTYTFTNITANHTISAAFNQRPVANAGSDKTGYVGTAISFAGSGTDADGAIASYSWSWGDGTADTNTQNVSHTYAAAGIYTATLTVTDNLGATGTDTAIVDVSAAPPNQPPVANAGSDKTGNAGSAISFTGSGTDADGTIASYSWNWGDGTADTNTQNASHTYAAAGIYTATLTVTDNQGATGTDTAQVTVAAAPPVNLALNKTATASSSRSGSTYVPANAVDGSGSTYWRSKEAGTQWIRVDFGSSQNVNNVKLTWNNSYRATNFRIETSTDATGSPTNWTQRWSTTSGTATVDATFTGVSARHVRVYCTSGASTSNYRLYELEAYGGPPPPNQAPVAYAGSDKSGYAGSAISFTGSGTDSDGTIAGYSWNWGDGTADTASQNPSHTYAAVGTYIATLTVTDNQGATGTDTATVTVSVAPPNQPPVANAGSDKTGTAGTAISFTGSGTDADGTIAGYSWNWGDGTANTTTQNASHTYAAAGSYTATLTVTDNLGATGSDTATVTVSAAPAGVAEPDGWTNIYSAAPKKTSETNRNVGSFTVNSGSNRLLLVAVVMELSSSANKTVSASYGGTSLTQVALTANSQREIVWVGRLSDTQIGSGSKSLTITYGGSGTVNGLHVKWASYSGVNQSNPIADSSALNTSSTSSTTFGSTVDYVNGGMTMVVAGNGGSSATGTLNATPSFTAGTATQASSHTSRTFVTARHTANGSYSSSTTVSWNSGSTGSGLVAVSLRP